MALINTLPEHYDYLSVEQRLEEVQRRIESF